MHTVLSVYLLMNVYEENTLNGFRHIHIPLDFLLQSLYIHPSTCLKQLQND